MTRNNSNASFQAVYPKRLGVILCNSTGTDLKPKGRHLRWFVPKSLGYPDGGFDLIKIKYSNWEKWSSNEKLLRYIPFENKGKIWDVNWSGKEKIQALDDIISLIAPADVDLEITEEGIINTTKRSNKNILFRFKQPVLYLRIELDEPDDSASPRDTVKIFYKSAQIGSKKIAKEIVFEQPNITDVLLPLGFRSIRQVCYVTEKSLIVREDILKEKMIQSFHIPGNVDDAYTLVESGARGGIHNRFMKADRIDQFIAGYPADMVSKLVERQQESLGNPGLTVDTIKQDGLSTTQVSVLDYLDFAALDPNVARMLACYTVAPESSHKNDLYIVIAKYTDQNLFGFCFSHSALPLPEVTGKIQLTQLPGISYRKSTREELTQPGAPKFQPLGSVGASWIENQKADAVHSSSPVFLDITRHSPAGPEEITLSKPQLATRRSKYIFRDSDLPLNTKFVYEVKGIDLFGRTGGETIKSEEISLKNLKRPVPPKKLKVKVKQHGFPWDQPSKRNVPDILRGELSAVMEFGEIQRRISPDVTDLVWLWRKLDDKDNLTDNLKVKHWNPFGTIRIKEPLSANVHFAPDEKMSDFSFRVEAVRETSHVVGENSQAQPMDPILRNALKSGDISMSPRLELLLDQALLEPDLFLGLMLTAGGHEYEVIGSTAGLAYKQDNSPDKKTTARLIISGTKKTSGIQEKMRVFLIDPIYFFRIEEVRKKDHPEDILHLFPRNSIFHNALNRNYSRRFRFELLLDQALLKPDLFLGTILTAGKHKYKVIGAKAGLAYKQDKSPDKKKTARLTILTVSATRNTPKIQKKMQLFLADRQAEGIYEGQQLSRAFMNKLRGLVRIRLSGKLEKWETTAAGGELALDFYFRQVEGEIQPLNAADHHQEKQCETFIARVVSDIRVIGDEREILVRMKPADFTRLLQINGQKIETQARYYPPYVLRKTIGLNGEKGDITLHMSPERRFERIAVSAVASVDNGPVSLEYADSIEEQEVATPVEARIINPPLVITPAPPYPGVTKDTMNAKVFPKGFAAMAKANGKASVRIAWDRVTADDGKENGIKYELARALDKSIILADQKKWLRGVDNSHHKEIGITQAEEVSGHLKSTYETSKNRSSIQLTVANVTEGLAEQLQSAVNGRIAVQHTVDGEAKVLFHKLLRVDYQEGSQECRLLCRPHIELTEQSMGEIHPKAPFSAQGMPDYSAVLKDDEALQKLADARYPSSSEMAGEGINEDAFGLVTGVPVATEEFVDTVPGIGTNRYFYKLRAVFANGLKSAWSNASVGFYQLDLSPAELPVVRRTVHVGEELLLILEKPSGNGERGFRLVKENQQNKQLEPVKSFLFDQDKSSSKEATLENAAIYAFNQIIDVRRLLEKGVLHKDNSEFSQLLGIFKTDTEKDNLLDDDSILGTNMIRLSDNHDVEGVPLLLKLEIGGETVEWREVPGQVQVRIATAGLEGCSLYVQTAKSIQVDHTRTQISLDSEPIRIFTVAEEIDDGH
ncbi:MAG: hypothetical protein QTN59_12100 [Candidatus Electrothrix communis]|nr:MAG: hypothetical protein QTN59_12100 [Candidatus Electrothrix communis]